MIFAVMVGVEQGLYPVVQVILMCFIKKKGFKTKRHGFRSIGNHASGIIYIAQTISYTNVPRRRRCCICRLLPLVRWICLPDGPQPGMQLALYIPQPDSLPA